MPSRKKQTAFVGGRLELMFRALRHKNFRLFVWGQSLSLIGTWLQMVALTWLVYHLTNSALMLGKEPFNKRRLRVDPHEDVVADIRILGVERPAAGFPKSGDDAA